MNKSLADFKVKFTFTTPKVAKAIAEAITPETLEDRSDRYHIKVHSYRNHLILEIGAYDLIALRAAANAYLRYINTGSNLLSFLEIQE